MRPGGVLKWEASLGSNGVCFADKSTDELLQALQNGGGESAFEEIVRRYAGMVYTVCLQVTRDVHDSEDATQAAFLTLALRAKTANSNIKYLGPWLQKVARRLSLDIMRAKKRRRKREEKRGAMVREMQLDRDPRRGLDRSEMADIVRDELSKLPAKYRLPLILHYFGGLRPEEVARELGYKPSTLGVRLHRGRKMLADSLAQRGITLTNGMLATILAGVVHIGISDNVMASTSLAAAGIGSNGEFIGSLISSRVLALTRQATNAIFWAKAKGVFAALVLSSAALAGTAQTLRAIVPDGLSWEIFDVTRIVRPLLRTLFGRPQFSIAPPPTSSAAGPESWIAGRDMPAMDWLSRRAPIIDHQLDPIGAGGSLDPINLSMPVFPLSARDGGLAVSSGSGSVSLALAGHEAPVATGAAATPLTSGTLALAAGSGPAFNAMLVSGTRFDYANRAIHQSARLQQFDSLLLDSRHSPFDTYVMNGPSARLVANRLVVGGAGDGLFKHLAGTVHVPNDLILGESRTGAGRYEMGPAAQLTAGNTYVGFSGTGNFVNHGGLHQTRALSIGHKVASRGTYALEDGTLQTLRTNVGVSGDGTLVQTGGLHVVGDESMPGVVSLGTNPTGRGQLLMQGGVLQTDTLLVGESGAGTYNQTGGTLAVTHVNVGYHETASGTALFTNGEVVLNSAARVVVGGSGTGTVMIGDNRGAAQINEAFPNSGADIVVRQTATATGLLRGHGEVTVTGSLINNGQIIADGFARARELDFTSASRVTNTIDNSEQSGRNGWFARRGGKLILPAIDVPDARTSTWGEDPNDPIPDLVNSVRFTVRDVRHPGKAVLSLIATDSTLLPSLPENETFIGMWGFDRKEGLVFGEGDLLVRYDDVLVRRLGGNENELRLWTYSDGWSMVPSELMVYEPTLNLLSGRVDGTFRVFGVSLSDATLPHIVIQPSIPEPGTAALAGIALGAALLRRRRR